MNISKEWLIEKGACQEGVEWFCNQKETDAIKIIKSFITAEEHLDWANWLIVRIMNYTQYVSYAVFAAEQVLDIYEAKYQNDKRPRTAIEAAKKCIENPNDENKKDAAYAARAAYADAAYAAAYAADAAAADAADAAADAAAYAARAYSSKKEVQKKILSYGLSLLEQQE